ncbi:MAG: hypothetical protein WBO44_14680 [Saprospiraceae bacterium]
MAQLTVIVNKLNRRRTPISDFSEKGNVAGTVLKGFQFISTNEISNELGNWYQDRDGYYFWGGGLAIISQNNPQTTNETTITVVDGKASIPLPHATPEDLPLSRNKCLLTAEWLELHYGDKFVEAVKGTPFTKELLHAIACQETALYFYNWTKDYTPDEILGRCVFDATGDMNGSRSTFPKNTAAFIEKYGQEIANLLIAEANKTRAMRGFGPKQWVYAGYGIFQYDIQSILTDEAFFLQKQWYEMEHCIEKVMNELMSKWTTHPNDLFKTIKAYNGSGPKAEKYANNVLQFLAWINNKT